MINELFQPGVIGQDLKHSLLQLINGINQNCFIPQFVGWANIAAVYKGKGDRLDLENDRGIFLVTVLRSILMRMVYNDKYEVIDSNMSDSNVGARKGMNIRNHIFIINGIINNVLQDKSKAVDIQILDYKQCFDSMWLEDTLNDLYDAGVRDDTLSLLYEANKNINVAVKTPHGLTERKNVKEIVLQGDVFGPIKCSVSVDTYGKQCIKEDIHMYTYKGDVKVPPLAMVDDVLIISECGYKSSMVNSYINAKSNMKKLQYGATKCHKMHVGKKKIEEICPDLYVDEWKLSEVTEIATGNIEEDCIDEYGGIQKMEEVSEEKYLGDILTVDGRNIKNIMERKNKSIGSKNQIMGILREVYFGKYYFEVAKVLRSALFLSSLLTNCEAWYNVSKVDRDMLEQTDETLLRNILECPSTTPKEMLYLELNCMPIRYILMKRRLNFLYYILAQKKTSLMYTFFQAQLKDSSKGDWCLTVQEDLNTLKISTPINELAKIPENSYMKMINDKVEKAAWDYLNDEKEKHDKVKHIVHSKVEMQKYLRPNSLTNEESKFIFQLRTRMLEVKCNYRGRYLNSNTLCPVCMKQEDTQAHIIECKDLDGENELVLGSVNYQHLFSDCLGDIIRIARIIRSRYKRRKEILKKRQERKMPEGPSDPGSDESVVCSNQQCV